MENKLISIILSKLKNKDVSFDEGLTDIEINKIEALFSIKFPPDLKLFLNTKLPVSNGFVHWRYGLNSQKGKKEIENWLNWPKEGILFDIKNKDFWFDDWGDKPVKFKNQKEIAENKLSKHPKLIPIYAHRYIPSLPNEIGNPVFSIYQTDIIYYGYDLASYLANEFKFDIPDKFGKIASPKNIDFWSKMVS